MYVCKSLLCACSIKKNNNIAICLCIQISIIIMYTGRASLTSNRSLNGSLCPHLQVTMTCSVENIPLLRWFTSSFNTDHYAYSLGDETRTPIDFEASPPLPTGVVIVVVNVTQSTVDPDWFTAVSTLNTTSSVLGYLNVQSVYCGSNEIQSETISVNFTLLG